MSKVESIEQEVQGLTPSELAAFRRWFLEFDAQVWDRQIEAVHRIKTDRETGKKSTSEIPRLSG